MRKNTMLNRILSCGLALALFVASPVSVIADDVAMDASVETTVENTSESQVASEGESEAGETPAEDKVSESDKASTDDAGQTKSGDSTSDDVSEKEEVNTDDARAGATLDKSTENKKSDEEVAETEDADKEEAAESEKATEEEAEDTEDETKYTYTSNGDGTHKKTWIDEDGKKHSEDEDCQFDEDGKCELCGYEKEADEEDDEYKLYGTFSIEVSGYTITAEVPEGAYDEKVKLVAEKVELSDEEKSLVDDELSAGIATSYVTFDIGLKNKSNEKIEPNDSVKISITSDLIEEDSEIIHIDDEGNAENISAESSDGEVVFEAESFSTYTIAGVNYKDEDNQVLYNNTAYGSAFSSAKFDKDLDWEYNIGANSYGLIIRYGSPAAQKRGYLIAPTADYTREIINSQIYEQSKAFVYGSGTNGKTEIHFVAPENYYIAGIGVYETAEAKSFDVSYVENDISKTKSFTNTYMPEEDKEYVPENDPDAKSYYTPSESYATYYKVNISMIKGETTTVRVFLKSIPTEFTSDTTIVKGAKLVNYTDDTKVFGNSFRFTRGGDDYSSNQCHYGQVYQGLGSDTIGTTFKLATSNEYTLFPDSINSSYITELDTNVGVEFKKTKDGYWTLDSSNYKYIYNSSNTKDGSNGVIEANSGSKGFWPFQGTNNGNDKAGNIHFGMELPINFSVNSYGTTTANGKTSDTIFKFSGDDDVFVYIDGHLVLDLGGIHNAISGQINFRTGDILIQGDDNNNSNSQNITKLTSSLDGSAYANRGIETTNLYTILKKYNIASNVSELSLKDHTLTVVYFERGAHESNCKISYNFEKNETTNVSYEGLKLKQNDDNTYGALAGATFTLYNDEACTDVAQIALGIEAVAVSDENGTISFENLSIGVADANNYATKTYYMKETNAAEGYVLPESAVWKLVVTYNNGSYSKTLTALNDEAMALSLDNKKNSVQSVETEVKGIVNNETPVAKKLTVEKIVSDGTAVNPDPNAEYRFYLGVYKGTGDVESVSSYEAGANQTYKVGNVTYTTDAEGEFSLKATEKAIFEELYGKKYIVAEISVDKSAHDYTLKNYSTRIIVDTDYDNVTTYVNTVDSWRLKTFSYADDTTEKSVKFENLFTNTTTNTSEEVLSKYIEKNAADDYDLNLTFKAPVYSEQTRVTTAEDNYDKAQLDIVVVFDLSNSMKGTKLTTAKEAVNDMVDSINTDEVDAQWKLVTFGSYAQLNTVNWEDSSSLKETVGSLTVFTGNDGGTNYQHALVVANTAANTDNRTSADTAVIFITDGQPTYHLCNQYDDSPTNNGGYYTGGGYYTTHEDYQGALMGAGALNCDYFYAVGIELSDSTVYTTSSNEALTGLGLITKVAKAVTSASVSSAYNASQSELSTVLSNIAGAFGTIYGSSTGEKTYEYATNAKIVDELSEYVEIIEGSDFYITVFDAEGNTVSGTSNVGKLGESDATFVLTKDGKQYTFKASYSDEGNGIITLDLDSSSDYKLGDYTYKVTFKVKPSTLAYNYMSENESYPVIDGSVTTGQSGTGTSSEGQAGFYSNNSAYASYTFRGGQVSKPYNKPVVQVENFWDWEVEKRGENTTNPLKGAEFILSAGSVQGATVVYYGKTYEDGIIRWYINSADRDNDVVDNQVSIPAGSYTLVESKAPTGYAKSADTWYITIDKINGITGYINEETNTLTSENSETILSNGVTKKIAKLYFRDEVLYTLPETGGSGVYVYTIGGILLMLAGALLLYKNKNNKK